MAAIQALGGPVAARVTRISQRRPGELTAIADAEFLDLAAALRQWPPQQRESLLRDFLRIRRRRSPFAAGQLEAWSMAHPHTVDGATGFAACLEVDPPIGITVIRQLAQVSKQKRIFKAVWRGGREIVLKQFLDKTEMATLVAREEGTHPLSMSSPYVIQSYVLSNEAQPSEKFVIEEFLPSILPLAWTASGIDEAANLIFDVGSALAYIHYRHGLIHSDVKPDNIGFRAGHYVLLDFGTAKAVSLIKEGVQPSGTMRTRAPELLGEDRYPESGDVRKADVWALGATIFQGFAGRFPLVTATQRIPGVSNPESRRRTELLLKKRADTEWGKWVTGERMPDPLRIVVLQMLDSNAANRPTSTEVVGLVADKLAAYLREPLATLEVGQIPISSELDNLEWSLPDERRVAQLPHSRRLGILARLRELLASEELLAGEASVESVVLPRLRRLLKRLEAHS